MPTVKLWFEKQSDKELSFKYQMETAKTFNTVQDKISDKKVVLNGIGCYNIKCIIHFIQGFQDHTQTRKPLHCIDAERKLQVTTNILFWVVVVRACVILPKLHSHVDQKSNPIWQNVGAWVNTERRSKMSFAFPGISQNNMTILDVDHFIVPPKKDARPPSYSKIFLQVCRDKHGYWIYEILFILRKNSDNDLEDTWGQKPSRRKNSHTWQKVPGNHFFHHLFEFLGWKTRI